MQVSKISSKGQITIPKFVRTVLQLSEGDQVAFSFEDGKVTVSKVDLEKVGFIQTEKVVTNVK